MLRIKSQKFSRVINSWADYNETQMCIFAKGLKVYMTVCVITVADVFRKLVLVSINNYLTD